MTQTLQTLARFALVTAIVGLAACGGGGDSSPAPTSPTSSSASPAPAPAPAAVPVPNPPPSTAPAPSPITAGSRATCNLANFASEALTLVNQRRAAGASCGSRGSFPAAPALSWSEPLTQASLVHSDDMVARNFFDHTGSNGSSAGDRATAAGYVWGTWGENIAAGQPTVSSVVAAWMASPGHCANIMNAAMRDIGLACVSGTANNTYRSYWTMTLGAQR